MEGIDLDVLQEKVIKLLGLLIDRQPGIVMWNMLLDSRLSEISKLLASAGYPRKEDV